MTSFSKKVRERPKEKSFFDYNKVNQKNKTNAKRYTSAFPPCDPVQIGPDQQECNADSGCLGGRTFEDFNCDGKQITTEPPLGGVVINIFNAENNLVNSTISDAQGDWQICNLDNSADYRIEFVLPTELSCRLAPSQTGEDNGSSIRFSEPQNCIDFAASPLDACIASSMILTSCYNFGGYQGQYKNNDAFVGFVSNKTEDPSTNALDYVVHYATHEQVGTTYGLAINHTTNKAYIAAYMKRHAGFGPGGTGAIYEVDLTQAEPPSIFADLNSIYGANTAGVNVHDFAENSGCSTGSNNFACWFNDVDAWGAVGQTSLGDMDISDDQSTLYVINLEDRAVYPIDLSNPSTAQTPFPFPLNQETDPTVLLKPRDAAYDVRPFGLKYHNGLVYVAAVDSELSRGRDNICCHRGGSVIYVYTLNPSTGAWNLVLEQDVQRAAHGPVPEYFGHWYDDFQDGYQDGYHMVPSDIEFDGDDIILGLRDMSSDKFGSEAGKPIPGDGTLIQYVTIAGDIIRFCYDNTSNTYNFENNGSCGGVTTSGSNTGGGWPESSTPRGSYYTGDYYTPAHPQTSLGGIWVNPDDNRLYSTVYDPINPFEAGVKSLDKTTGEALEAYVLIADTRPSGGFGKAAGLGDVEGACPILPIEIGNYIWFDENKDGIQNASEPGIDGVTVKLYDAAGLLVGITTSQNNGQYYFNEKNVDVKGVNSNGSATGIYTGPDYSSEYHIVFGEGQFSAGTFTQAGSSYVITENSNTGNNDNIDSDVSSNTFTSGGLGTRPDGLPFISLSTGSTACGDHKYDLGLTRPCSLTIVGNSQSGCQNNTTPTFSQDDYFILEVSAENSFPGTSNTYEVVLYADSEGVGGTVLGSALYGESISLGDGESGNTGIFSANGVDTYTITVRDKDTPACFENFSTTSVDNCYEDVPCILSVETSQPNYNDNGTPNNLNDDTFSFEVTITGQGTGGWTGGGQSGNFGETRTFGPYPVDNEGVIFDISDANNSQCSVSIGANMNSCIYTGACTCCSPN